MQGIAALCDDNTKLHFPTEGDTLSDVPRVAVVIPAYNPGVYLRETLDSVIRQTFTDWQAVVVDDGSTENLGWVDGIHPQVRRLRQPNLGTSVARNAGIATTDSEYVAFLDHDDVWLPDKLAAQVPATEGARAALSSTAFEIIDGASDRVSDGYEGYAESYLDLLQGDGICTSTTLACRAVVDEVGVFDTSTRGCEDWDLWLRIARDHKVIKLPTVLARYRQHGSNRSREYMRVLRGSNVILRRHEWANGPASPEAQAARIGQRRVRERVGIQAFDHCRAAFSRSPAVASRHLASALHYAPRYTLRAIKSKITREPPRPGRPEAARLLGEFVLLSPPRTLGHHRGTNFNGGLDKNVRERVDALLISDAVRYRCRVNVELLRS